MELNLFYIAMRGQESSATAPVSRTLYGVGEVKDAPAVAADRSMELVVKAVPITADPRDPGTEGSYPLTYGQLWQLSQSVVTCSDVE